VLRTSYSQGLHRSLRSNGLALDSIWNLRGDRLTCLCAAEWYGLDEERPILAVRWPLGIAAARLHCRPRRESLIATDRQRALRAVVSGV
jgi:hypothetical protein